MPNTVEQYLLDDLAKVIDAIWRNNMDDMDDNSPTGDMDYNSPTDDMIGIIKTIISFNDHSNRVSCYGIRDIESAIQSIQEERHA
ncbi:MAG: hypothetical protein P4L79_10155 [Legionella sp.]|uniref:hypothetical protein n=1 Tax=Legionella sp. TaxID=459 RepID=UPI00283E8CEA|nr:hypothetical protein [Legionella sp.]